LNSPRALAGRIALVTGASRGIGAGTALALGKAGAHVVAVARTVGGLEELDDAIRAAGGSATLVPLDVTDFEGLGRLAAALQERYRRLDILIGNAGLAGPSSPLDHITATDWDEVMKVNVTANWQLICAMDALLRRSDAGRAVFLTSGAAHNLRAYRGLYSVSKAALEALARTYAAETANTPVRVNLVSARPGDAGRRPGDPAAAGTGRRNDSGAVRAGVCRDRAALRFPVAQADVVPPTGVRHGKTYRFAFRPA
jgi:NAD(P)-dependent dehydrogenase (short-subunit alcohol dehydrogenase family)